MLDSDPQATHVACRLLDFFGSKTRWQRRLWDVGLVLAIDEALEAGEAVSDGILAAKSTLAFYSEILEPASRDPGIGGPEEMRLLQTALKSDLRPGGYESEVLRDLLERIQELYLQRWASVLSDVNRRPKPERAARALAARMLDAGFSADYLHRWWAYQIRHRSGRQSLPELVMEMDQLIRTPARNYEVLVAFSAAPRTTSTMPAQWRGAVAVAQWLQNQGISRRDVRQAGGFLLMVSARDGWTAVSQAADIVDRLVARVSIGTRSQLRPLDVAWVAGSDESQALHQSRRVEVLALEREGRLYDLDRPGVIDAALELLATLDHGAAAPAAATAWAAIESLLVAPGDEGKGVAGNRLASLVACSFPRAELTTLAYAHERSAADELACRLQGADTNREKAMLIADAIKAREPLTLPNPSDQAARVRMEALLDDPRTVLGEIERYAARAFARLYRQRNLVLHGGRVNAVALPASLRTAAPLVGAGVDRIAHGWFADRVNPLSLAARARIELSLADTAGGKGIADLLEWSPKP